MRCPSCGEDNPDRAHFCLACATPLTADDRPSVDERRVVSVLFCDLVGSTARAEQADPEDVAALLAVYHSRVRAVLERFGGTVEKFIGDAVVAVFGAPVAHEDDAERAVRAGLRALDAVHDLNEEKPALDVAVRIAVTTGETVIRLGARPERGEAFVAGDVVNTAAGLQGVAEAGTLVVGAGTWRATRDTIDYVALDPALVKGKAEPVPLWHAVGARSRAEVAQGATSMPFVGRELELAMLQQVFHRAQHGRAPQLVTVVGEPGIGKSRLVAELARWVDDKEEIISWRTGRCPPYGEGITFSALSDIIQAEAGIHANAPAEEIRTDLARSVAAAIPDPADQAWVTARLGMLVGLPETAGASREESFAAWMRFLEGVAAHNPLVLVVDDLHWADDALLAFIEHLVDAGSDVPLVVIATARPELLDRAPTWGASLRNNLRLDLGPLSQPETAALLGHLLDTTLLPTETQTALLDRAAGNPLFAGEFVRMLTDQGLLQRDGRAVRLDPTVDATVPDSVQSVIAARLDTLPPDGRHALQAAAVVGKVFWLGAVADMTGLAAKPAELALHDMERRDLVHRSRATSLAGQVEYAFHHDVIRDVAYAQLARTARMRWHEAAARWLAASTSGTERADLLAHHYLAAHAAATAAGELESTTRLAALAVERLRAAGDQVAELDPAGAGRHYQRALDLTRENDPARGRLLLSLADSLRFVSLEQAQRGYDLALRTCRATGDVSGEVLALVGAGYMVIDSGNGAAAPGYARAAEALLPRLPSGDEHAATHHLLAYLADAQGDPEATLTDAEKALSAAPPGSWRRTTIMWARGFAQLALGDGDAAVANMRMALSEAELDNAAVNRAASHAHLGEVLWWTADLTQAAAAFDAGLQFAESRGLAALGSQIAGDRTWVWFDQGRWDDLELGSNLERTDEGRFLVGELPRRALVSAWRGHLAAAGEAVAAVLPKAREAAELQFLVPTLAVTAVVCGLRGDRRGATNTLRELAGLAADRGGLHRALFLPDLVETAIGLGDVDLSHQLADAVAPTMTRLRLARLSADALLAEAEGRLAEAGERYAEAVPGWTAYGAPFETARAQLGLGRCQHQRGDPTAADARRAARATFSGLGATTMLAIIDAVNADMTASSS